MDVAFNITDQLSIKYPLAKMIFPNKTLILLTKQSRSSNATQQMALLAGMAFIGGIVAGLLIRCIYFGIVNFFRGNGDQLASSSQRPNRGNSNPSFVGDNFVNDQPPDYVTVMTETSRNPVPQLQEGVKPTETRVYEERPPAYITIVSNISRFVRSASR